MDAVLNEDLLKKFTIDLDDKLNDIGYRRKSTLVKRLIREYRQEIDFIIIRINPSSKRDIYLLTEDCYEDIKRRELPDDQKEELCVKEENYLIDDTVGRLDLLTDQEVIEVKPAKEWKEALGQVLVYQTYFENEKPRIHLFISLKDKESQAFLKEEEKEKVEQCCEKLNVKVTWHEPELPKFPFQPLIEAELKISKFIGNISFF